MNIGEIKKQAQEKMVKSIETLKHDLSKVRTGRAHAGLVDHLKVDYYGTDTPIPQVANVTLADARTIQIQPWDKKMVQAVERAIRDSDLGVNPATSGDVIRVPMPPLTEERRRDLVKMAKKVSEESKVGVRNARRDAMDLLKHAEKDEHMSEDARKGAEADVQKLTDKYIAEVDHIVGEKEKDIMTV